MLSRPWEKQLLLLVDMIAVGHDPKRVLSFLVINSLIKLSAPFLHGTVEENRRARN